MRRKRLIAAAVIVILAGGGYLAWRLIHPPISDQEQINRLLDRVEQGVETRRPRDILSAIADDYHDAAGLTKRDLHRMTLVLLRLPVPPEVVIDKVDIRVRGDAAVAGVQGRVTLNEGGLPPELFSGAITVELRKRRGEWLVVSTAGWQGRLAEETEE